MDKNEYIAQFVGADRSMGFRTGLWYRIRLDYVKGMVMLREETGLYCPYESIGALRRNWRFEKNEIPSKIDKRKDITDRGKFYFRRPEIGRSGWRD